MVTAPNKSYKLDIIKFAVYVITLLIAAMTAYSAINTRIAVIETKMEQKVDKEELFRRLDDMRIRIESKIETEVKKIKG
jgi:hypothetical protein